MQTCIVDKNKEDVNKLAAVIKKCSKDIVINEIPSMNGHEINNCDILFIDYDVLKNKESEYQSRHSCIIITTVDNPDMIQRSLSENSCRAIIQKPFDVKRVNDVIGRLIYTRGLVDNFINNSTVYKNILLAFDMPLCEYGNIMHVDMRKCTEMKCFEKTDKKIVFLNNLSLLHPESIKMLFFSNFHLLRNVEYKFIIDYRGLPGQMNEQFKGISFIFDYLIEHSFVLSSHMS